MITDHTEHWSYLFWMKIKQRNIFLWSLLFSQVLVTLDHLERVSTFQEFVQIFSQFGNEMVEFAHLTGDRQNVSRNRNH